MIKTHTHTQMLNMKRGKIEKGGNEIYEIKKKLKSSWTIDTNGKAIYILLEVNTNRTEKSMSPLCSKIYNTQFVALMRSEMSETRAAQIYTNTELRKNQNWNYLLIFFILIYIYIYIISRKKQYSLALNSFLSC